MLYWWSILGEGNRQQWRCDHASHSETGPLCMPPVEIQGYGSTAPPRLSKIANVVIKVHIHNDRPVYLFWTECVLYWTMQIRTSHWRFHIIARLTARGAVIYVQNPYIKNHPSREILISKQVDTICLLCLMLLILEAVHLTWHTVPGTISFVRDWLTLSATNSSAAFYSALCNMSYVLVLHI
jgi:hypothetical protein